MHIYAREDALHQQERLAHSVKQGALFVHATDTYYSLCCSAVNENAVAQLRLVKQCRRPFAVIAPSKEWIRMNFEIPKAFERHFNELPASGLFVLPLKNKNALAPNVHNGKPFVAVKLPDHHISTLAYNVGQPLVATSANIVGRDVAHSIESLDGALREHVRFFVDEGVVAPQQQPVYSAESLTPAEIKRINN